LVIVLNRISKSYGDVVALRDVNLTVPDKTIYGIIGKSGAGKSTLLRIMSLLEPTDTGSVYYGNERVDMLTGKELLDRRRNMGMIFQNFNLLSSRDAEGNIAYPLEIAGVPKKEIKSRVSELLEMVDIQDKQKARMRELSGGQKQRVAIARALAAKPDALFCDEATSALDPQTTRSVLSLIKDLHEKLKITVVLITHQMSVIRDVCQQVAVLENGEIVEQGAVGAVFNSPKTQAAKELVNV
jgi:D-methionine transport system ATP-binding protein